MLDILFGALISTGTLALLIWAVGPAADLLTRLGRDQREYQALQGPRGSRPEGK